MEQEKVREGQNTEKTAMRVSMVSILVNIALALGKFTAGILASSGAMVSDAVHSASDVVSTFVVIIGIRLSGKKEDAEHPYGHERMECVAAIVLAVVLAITGLEIGAGGIKKIVSGGYGELAVPGILALIAAEVSIFVKEWMYWYTRYHAKKVNSSALLADAWHHRSDSLSSVGAFIGILGARMGFPIMDTLASLAICMLILKAAYDIFKDAIDKMVDKACDKETEQRLKELVAAQQGVVGVDTLRTRTFGNRIYVDVEILAEGTLSLYESHAIAERVHDEIEAHFQEVKHIMVHVNPC